MQEDESKTKDSAQSKRGICTHKSLECFIQSLIIAEPRGKQLWCIVVSHGYVCMYAYPQLAQCNSMLVYVYLQCLCKTILCSCMYISHTCATTRSKCAPGGRLWAVWRQVRTASADCKLFGRLGAYIALTSALVHYATDKGVFITTRQKVGQTIKDLRHSEYAHGGYISSEMP